MSSKNLPSEEVGQFDLAWCPRPGERSNLFVALKSFWSLITLISGDLEHLDIALKIPSRPYQS